MRTHQILIILLSLIFSIFFCLGGFATCRHLPIYYYLLGVLESKTFERDPVMLVFVASFIVTISCLQLCIEVKKYNASRLEKRNEESDGGSISSSSSSVASGQDEGEWSVVPKGNRKRMKLKTKSNRK